MQRILVERARRLAGPKRGGGRHRYPIEAVDPTFDKDPVEMLALDEALTTLERRDRRMSDIVRLRYFVGLTVEETAAQLGISPRTVKREWPGACVGPVSRFLATRFCRRLWSQQSMR